jgi:hypothetical protein
MRPGRVVWTSATYNNCHGENYCNVLSPTECGQRQAKNLSVQALLFCALGNYSSCYNVNVYAAAATSTSTAMSVSFNYKAFGT